MDYAAGIFFFALGLGIALLLRGAWRFNKGEGGLGNLPVKDGAVRLDLLAGRAQRPEPRDGAMARPTPATGRRRRWRGQGRRSG